MTVVIDSELLARINCAAPMVREMPPKVAADFASQPNGVHSPVQPCSIDLHVGEIYLQTDAEEDLPPRKEYDLPPGHSAVVTTYEVLDIPADLGAVAFPLAGRGQRGILMMNPGHIDPGYEGKLWFSLINLSRESFRLSQGDRVATVLFWKTSGVPLAAWKARCGNEVHLAPPPEVVKSIAGDALMLEARAEAKAEDVVARRTQEMRDDVGEEKKKVLWWGAALGGVLPIVVTGILTWLITSFGTVSTLRDESVRLRADLEKQAVELKAALSNETTPLKTRAQSLDDALNAQKVFLDGKTSQLEAKKDEYERKSTIQEQQVLTLIKTAESQKERIAILESALPKKPSTEK